ncbi:hypothetical protein V2J09_019613 [Rumex salicifolius]
MIFRKKKVSRRLNEKKAGFCLGASNTRGRSILLGDENPFNKMTFVTCSWAFFFSLCLNIGAGNWEVVRLQTACVWSLVGSLLHKIHVDVEGRRVVEFNFSSIIEEEV